MNLVVEFKEITEVISAEFQENDKPFGIQIDAYYSRGEKPMYEGDVEVTPTVEEQILHTKDTVLNDDITINRIPYYETENDKGGITVYIAG